MTTRWDRRKPTALLGMVIVLLAVALTATAAAGQQTRAFRWQYINVDIDIQPDGSAIITEEQQISFEGPYSFVTRVIPLERMQGITDVAVGDENGWYSEGVDPDYEPVAYAGYVPKGQPGRFTVERARGEVTIAWYFVALSETRTFRVRYRAAGIVRMHKDADEVWWAAIGPDRGAEVAQAAATIRLPQRVPPDSLEATAYQDESPVRDGAQTNDYGASYQYLRTIPEDESWTVRLFFPHGVATAVAPIPFRNYAAPLIISIALAAAAVAVFVRSANASRIRLEPLTRTYSQPPEDLPPGLIAYLFNPFGTFAGAATFLDLAQRGYFTVTRIQFGRSTWRSRVQYDINDTGKDRSGLLAYERSLLEALLERTPFSNTQLQTLLAAVNQNRQISQEADRHGWFASQQQPRLSVGSVVLGALAIVAACVGLTIWAAVVGPEWLVIVPILLGTLVLVLQIIRPMLTYMQRSESGARAHQRWGSFFRLLRRPSDVIARDPGLALQWLPYAVAAGLAYNWQRALRGDRSPAPAWYRSEGGAVPLTDLLMADFVRDMFWVGMYAGGGGAGGGVGGASGGGGGTAG